MTRDEALSWLAQAGGTLFHNRKRSDPDEAWVAVVRTPPTGGRTGKIILAFGDSLESATRAAEERWNELWREMSQVH